MYYGLLSVGGIALAGATELFPEINEQLKLVKFPSAVSNAEGVAISEANQFDATWLP